MKTKKYIYVGVQTGYGLALVTKVDMIKRQAWWGADDEPISLGLKVARDVSWELNVNGYESVVVESLIDFDNQPFLR